MAYRCRDEKLKQQRLYSKKWYQANKEQHIKKVAENKKKYRADWIKYKEEQVCAHCGAAHPAIIDFHHTERHAENVKVYALAGAGRYAAARKEAEERCIPLCANCHRIHHWNEGLESRSADHEASE